MGGVSWEILILLVLAVVVFWRLLSEFGKRDGYEPERKIEAKPSRARPAPQVIEEDIDTEFEAAITSARKLEPDFTVSKFLTGAKAAYEMILMAYLNDDMRPVKDFVDADVYAGFEQAIRTRVAKGHFIEAEFVGFQDLKLYSADFDKSTNELELGVTFVAQLKQQTVDAKGAVIEGDKSKIETEQDTWFFARKMGSNDPNWELVATDV